MTYAKCSKADIVGETSQLLQYISPQFLLKSQVKAQDGKSLIMSVILIGIDFSSRWELFISRGNTYFHRSRNDINPREQMKLKLGIFLSLFPKNPIIDRSITHCSITHCRRKSPESNPFFLLRLKNAHMFPFILSCGHKTSERNRAS